MTLQQFSIIIGIIITIIVIISYTYFIFKTNRIFKFFRFFITLNPKDVLYMLLYVTPLLLLMYFCIWLIHLLY